jgi:hypothetical protein
MSQINPVHMLASNAIKYILILFSDLSAVAKSLLPPVLWTFIAVRVFTVGNMNVAIFADMPYHRAVRM